MSLVNSALMARPAALESVLEAVLTTRIAPANTSAFKIAAKTLAHWDVHADPTLFALPKTRLKPASAHQDLQVCQLPVKVA